MAKKAKQTKKAGKKSLAVKAIDVPAKVASGVKGGKARITIT